MLVFVVIGLLVAVIIILIVLTTMLDTVITGMILTECAFAWFLTSVIIAAACCLVRKDVRVVHMHHMHNFTHRHLRLLHLDVVRRTRIDEVHRHSLSTLSLVREHSQLFFYQFL